ncbi:MAG: ABC transporter ATP-binding protein, partial [Eubacterium sp.]|nr:ABC transporter ATP-binding protein [Eubacterium sp.]
MAQKNDYSTGRGPRGHRRGMGAPGPKLENPGKLIKRLLAYVMERYGIQYGIVIICIITSVLCNVQGTMFMKTLIDRYITPMLLDQSHDFNGLNHAIIRVASFYALGVIASFLQQQIMIIVTQGTMKSLRKDIFNHMESLPIKYFDTHAHGDIMSVYTNDTDTLRQMISQSIPQFINSGITIISVVACMIVLSIPLTLVTFVMVIVMLFCSKKLAGFSGGYFMKQQQDLGKVNGFIEEMLSGQKVVKVFNHEEENIRSFNERNDSLYESAYNANKFA